MCKTIIDFVITAREEVVGSEVRILQVLLSHSESYFRKEQTGNFDFGMLRYVGSLFSSGNLISNALFLDMFGIFKINKIF